MGHAWATGLVTRPLLQYSQKQPGVFFSMARSIPGRCILHQGKARATQISLSLWCSQDLPMWIYPDSSFSTAVTQGGAESDASLHLGWGGLGGLTPGMSHLWWRRAAHQFISQEFPRLAQWPFCSWLLYSVTVSVFSARWGFCPTGFWLAIGYLTGCADFKKCLAAAAISAEGFAWYIYS